MFFCTTCLALVLFSLVISELSDLAVVVVAFCISTLDVSVECCEALLYICLIFSSMYCMLNVADGFVLLCFLLSQSSPYASLRQLSPLLFMIVVWCVTSLFASEPLYSLRTSS